MKTRGWIRLGSAVVGLMVMVTFAWAQQDAPGTYTIKKGDTLWGISSGLYKDPFLWPRLWSANPKIKNPNRLRPGQVLALPTAPTVAAKPGEAPAEPGLETERVAGKAPEGEEAAPMPEAKHPEKEILMASSGFLAAPEDLRGEIVGSWDGRVLLGEGDKVYLMVSGSSVGERLSVIRLDRKISHPVTGKNLGYLVKALGDVKVLAIEGNIATAMVERSFDWMEEGDRIVTATAARWKPGEGAVPSLSGYIVASMDNKQGLGELDVVYLDRGQSDGVAPGATFTILQPEERTRIPSSGKWVTLPPRVVGKAQVLGSRTHTATALITQSLKEIYTGYAVRTEAP